MQNIQYHIFPLGDSAITIDFGNRIDADVNKQVIRLGNIINENKFSGIRDIVPAYSSLTVHYDVVEMAKKTNNETAFAFVKNKLETLLSQQNAVPEKPALTIKIPVCYAPKYAPDIADVCSFSNLPFNDIINIHTARSYRVYMVGFLPGFAYMGEVDERISAPRKSNPRLKIDAGSVGIAGRQTGIYPLSSPGGWQIIGRTPVKLWDKEKESPSLLKAGDEVKFFSIREDEFEDY